MVIIHTLDPRIINNMTWCQKFCTDPYNLKRTNLYLSEFTENDRENMVDKTAQRAPAGSSVTFSIQPPEPFDFSKPQE